MQNTQCEILKSKALQMPANTVVRLYNSFKTKSLSSKKIVLVGLHWKMPLDDNIRQVSTISISNKFWWNLEWQFKCRVCVVF